MHDRYKKLSNSLDFSLREVLRAVLSFEHDPFVWSDTAETLRVYARGSIPGHVDEEGAQEALWLLRHESHGSPLWRLLICFGSGYVTKEDLLIIAEVIEAQ